ncbi:MAG: division/cell wall cluster transcriptional repressor MraZ [Jiangellaceae bacterium]|nr:division/cell wall cluster transcriptional repressor MraZ [Jiangellaceae bacterium]
MFLGTHFPRLDDKGRLILPAKFREQLAEGVVITRGQERCLYVWPRAEFLRFTERLRAAPITNRGVRDFARMLSAGGSDEVPDRQGRIPIPSVLREYAGLDRDCAVVGAMDRVEIWAPAAWRAYQADKEQLFADVSEEVLPGIF